MTLSMLYYSALMNITPTRRDTTLAELCCHFCIEGEEGVRKVVLNFLEELDLILALGGYNSLRFLDRSALVREISCAKGAELIERNSTFAPHVQNDIL